MSKLLVGVVAIAALIGGFYWFNGYIYDEKQGGVENYGEVEFRIEGETVQLVDGEARTAQAGAASEGVVRYFGNEAKGDLNDDGVPDMAFLVTQESGGSGTFFYVVGAIQNAAGRYQGTDAVFVGDRIAPQTTEIRDGILIVNYADRAPGEPMTAQPSMGKSLYLQLDPQTFQFSEHQGMLSMPTYANERYGISFQYPGGYRLVEFKEEGSELREQYVITLIREADLPLPENGEGPPAITVNIYQNNLDSLTTEEWIRNSSASNFKLSPEERLTELMLDGKPALSYRWSGLYEGTTVALARPDWVYAFSVTYLEPGADIVQDFVALRESVVIR